MNRSEDIPTEGTAAESKEVVFMAHYDDKN
jgi:hypothetical protein